MLCLFELLSVLSLLGYDGYATSAPQHSLNRASEAVTVTTNLSTAPIFTQALSSSSANPSTSGIRLIDEHNTSPRIPALSNTKFSTRSKRWRISPRSIINVPSQLPAPFNRYTEHDSAKYLSKYDHIKSGFCIGNDDLCSFKGSNGTIIESNATDFSDQCF